MQRCLAIDKPFWGACSFKDCCEGKKLEHCGACPELPCAEHGQLARDKEHGDDGRRIEQCKEWQKKRSA